MASTKGADGSTDGKGRNSRMQQLFSKPQALVLPKSPEDLLDNTACLTGTL